MNPYPHEQLHAEFLAAIAESGLTDHGLGNYWSAELDEDPGALTSKVRRWKSKFPSQIIALSCLMDAIGYTVSIHPKVPLYKPDDLIL